MAKMTKEELIKKYIETPLKAGNGDYAVGAEMTIESGGEEAEILECIAQEMYGDWVKLLSDSKGVIFYDTVGAFSDEYGTYYMETPTEDEVIRGYQRFLAA